MSPPLASEPETQPTTTTTTTTEWYPTQHLHQKARACALIILNQPITDISLFVRLWEHSTYRICADGGANRLFDLFDSNTVTHTHTHTHTDHEQQGQRRRQWHRESFPPDEICGDLDSVRSEVREYYEKQQGRRRVRITYAPGQDATDFEKCVDRVDQVYHNDNNNNNDDEDDDDDKVDILVLGGLGGRIDQAFAQLHQLYALATRPRRRRGNTFLFSDENISFLLSAGRNLIHTRPRPHNNPNSSSNSNSNSNSETSYLAPHVGLIPLGRPARISTRGLQWDVHDWYTAFPPSGGGGGGGAQISTSNLLRPDVDVVVVVTDVEILWTVERRPGCEMPRCECACAGVMAGGGDDDDGGGDA